MQGVKISFVGQTFALAMCNDSQGKKRRIRRTKEERRVMAESFIKRYRIANNGEFPSLNLTHKEVGGSFYTVREIMREITGELMMNGSSNSSLEEHNLDISSEEASGRFHGQESQGFMSLSLAIGKETCDTKVEGQYHGSEHQCVTGKPATLVSTYSTNMNFEMVEHSFDQKQTYDPQKQNKDLLDKEYKRASMWAPSEQGEIKEISEEFHDGSIEEGRIEHIEPLNGQAEASPLLLPNDEKGGVSVTFVPHKAEISESSSIAGGIKNQDICQTMSIPSSPLIISDKIGKQNDGMALVGGVIVENNIVSETVVTDGLPETKTTISKEIGENSVKLQDQLAPVHARAAFPLTSNATPPFSLETGPEDTQSFYEILEKSHASAMKDERSPALVNSSSAVNVLEPHKNLSSSSVCEKEMALLVKPISESTGCCITGENLMIGLLDSGKDDQSKKDADLQVEMCDNKLPPIVDHNNVQALSVAGNADGTREVIATTVVKEESTETEARIGSGSSERGSDPVPIHVKHSGASKQETREAMKPKVNPIWAVIKAFFSAFVKFWTE